MGPDAYSAESWIFRVASGSLTEIHRVASTDTDRPAGDVRKSAREIFRDDDLRFSYSIWNPADPGCCPTGGEVEGNYMIVGDELRLPDWGRK